MSFRRGDHSYGNYSGAPARKAISSADNRADGAGERSIGGLLAIDTGFAGAGAEVFSDGSADGTVKVFAHPGQLTVHPAADASMTTFLPQSGQANLISNSWEPHARICLWQ